MDLNYLAMRKRDIRMDYRGWKFRDKVPLIPRDRIWKAYFDGKFGSIDVDVDIDEEKLADLVEETFENAFEGLDGKFCKVHKHIEDAKDHLCCDICCAKKDIKKHIDDKFDEIDFEQHFSNLNEQAEIIIQKLNNL